MCGKTDEESDINLKRRTTELSRENIVLNDKKIVAEKKEIVFMGHIVIAESISPNPAKVEVIQNLPIPTDVTAVRRLCGTISLSVHSKSFTSHGTSKST